MTNAICLFSRRVLSFLSLQPLLALLLWFASFAVSLLHILLNLSSLSSVLLCLFLLSSLLSTYMLRAFLSLDFFRVNLVFLLSTRACLASLFGSLCDSCFATRHCLLALLSSHPQILCLIIRMCFIAALCIGFFPFMHSLLFLTALVLSLSHSCPLPSPHIPGIRSYTCGQHCTPFKLAAYSACKAEHQNNTTRSLSRIIQKTPYL